MFSRAERGKAGTIMKNVSPTTPRLNAKQQRVLDELPTSETITEAAEKAGVARGLIRQWLEHDEFFLREVKVARRQAVGEATGRLQQLASMAVGKLSDLIQQQEIAPASRVTAIRIALDFAYRAAELDQLEEIEGRLGRVEALLDDLPADLPAAEVHWIEQGKTKVIRPK